MTFMDGTKAIWQWQFLAQAEKTYPAAFQTAAGYGGSNFLLAKVADGMNPVGSWDPGNANSPTEFYEMTRQLAVAPWVVPHGNLPGGPGQEATYHATFGPILVVDVEPYVGFWQGSAYGLVEYLNELRSSGVKELHLSFDPRPQAIQALGGLGKFLGFLDGLHPQCYWTDFGSPASLMTAHVKRREAMTLYKGGVPASYPRPWPAQLLPDASPGSALQMIGPLFDLGLPVYPTLPGDGSADDMRTFAEGIARLGCKGASVWRLGSMDLGQLAAWKAAPVGSTPIPPVARSLEERVSALEKELARLNTTLANFRFRETADALAELETSSKAVIERLRNAFDPDRKFPET